MSKREKERNKRMSYYAPQLDTCTHTHTHAHTHTHTLTFAFLSILPPLVLFQLYLFIHQLPCLKYIISCVPWDAEFRPQMMGLVLLSFSFTWSFIWSQWLDCLSKETTNEVKRDQVKTTRDKNDILPLKTTRKREFLAYALMCNTNLWNMHHPPGIFTWSTCPDPLIIIIHGYHLLSQLSDSSLYYYCLSNEHITFISLVYV